MEISEEETTKRLEDNLNTIKEVIGESDCSSFDKERFSIRLTQRLIRNNTEFVVNGFFSMDKRNLHTHYQNQMHLMRMFRSEYPQVIGFNEKIEAALKNIQDAINDMIKISQKYEIAV